MLESIHAFKITQNEKDILIFSIAASQLCNITYYNRREIDREKGIQRPYKAWRSRDIAEYIDNEDGLLPNDIIINFELKELGFTIKDVYNEKKQVLNIERMKKAALNRKDRVAELKGKVAFVIDGQHRLRAFEFSTKKDFPLLVAALTDLSLAEIAEIFVKINYYQVPVNKSHVFDLLGISENIFPEYYELHKIVKKLAEDDIASPFYGKIKMLGIGSGYISQASLITAIENYNLRDVLKNNGIEVSTETMYYVIWNFYTAIARTFPAYWQKKTIITKTIGIRALFMLMIDMLNFHLREKIKFSVHNIMKKIEQLDISRLDTAEINAFSGEKGVRVMFDKIRDMLK